MQIKELKAFKKQLEWVRSYALDHLDAELGNSASYMIDKVNDIIETKAIELEQALARVNESHFP